MKHSPGSRVQLSIRIWYSSSAGASCLPALVCFQSHLSPVPWIMSVWFGQGLVNRLWVAIASSGEMGRAWCACWLKACREQAGQSSCCWAGVWHYPWPASVLNVMFPLADGVSSGLIKDHNCDLVTRLVLLSLELSEPSGCLRELLILACSGYSLCVSFWD